MRAGARAMIASAALIAVLAGCTDPRSSNLFVEDPDRPAVRAEVAEIPGQVPQLQQPPERVTYAAAGDLLSEEEAEFLPEWQTGYPLPDGTWVVVDRNEELPQVLVEEIQAGHTGEVEAQYRGPERAAGAEAVRMVRDVALKTGRQIILVSRAGSYGLRGELERIFWAVVATGEASEINIRQVDKYVRDTGTREQSLAYARWLLEQLEDPDSYQIIVIDN